MRYVAWCIVVFVMATNAVQAQNAPVSVTTVESRTIAPVVDIPGTVISRLDSQISSELSGRVTWVADEGSSVEEGAAIARLNKRDYALALASAEAVMGRLTAQLELAQSQFERREQLTERGVASAATFDQALAETAQLSYRLQEAEAARDRAQLNLERTSITAPFSGQVTQRFLQPGEHASRGDAIIRLVNTQNIEGRVFAPIALASHLEGRSTVGYSTANWVGSANLRAVVPGAVNGARRTFELRLSLDTPRPPMVGAAITARLPSDTPRSALAASRDALVFRDGRTFVWRLRDDETVERIAVEIGGADGDYVELIGEIAEGDQLIIRGAERLSEGQSVSILG